MQKENKLIFLIALTLTVYATSIYLQQGAFIFPFPLNPILLLLVTARFFFWHKEKGLPAFLLLLVGIFTFLGSEIYWSFILVPETMITFSESLITDLFQLGAYICLIIFSVNSALRAKKTLFILLNGIFLTLFIYGQLFESPISILLSYSFMIGANVYKPVFQPLQLIWILLFILDGSKLISFLLN